ncbi:MAG: serine/threonine protein kinase [Proteobacteria bacterium]|nr:serine/threonine protein kinase [Pseudomonadota bacterium]NOG61007.1 serine/threonine protein kinase [Pseudomonadota bacterium]
MTTFPELPRDEYDIIYLENTDKELPTKLNQSTRYAYFKTIAKGGKALVQSCKDLHLSRVICYKKLRSEFADDPIENKRFLREARVSALLQHPNTIPMYELGREANGHYYFTMKLVHGYTLREVLDYRERYDLTQLINVLKQVAHALEYAHSHHVIHRDIKPENILVGPFGEVLLMDWGLAKVWNPDGTSADVPDKPKTISKKKVSSFTDLEKLQGTISYMSPEQIQRDPDIDFRTDIYSLGAVLFEILAGRPPSIEETVDKLIEETLNVIPPKPSSLTKVRVPELLEDVAMRCIAKSVDNRIQSCSELVRLLEEDWN